MVLQERFIAHWRVSFPHLTADRCRLLVAVSGGVDSVVLVDLLHRAGFRFTMAHCNFQLRGQESERDEQFVQALAERYHLPLDLKRMDTEQYASAHTLSVQEAARELRYAWFREIVEKWEQDEKNTPSSSPSHIYTLTAHHADDNIETVLMHFFRGTGIQGLTGIQPLLKEQHLLRPLLSFRKKELQAYAAEQQLDFVEDSSNASNKYTRNYFRNQLLPRIGEVYPHAAENLLGNIERLREVAILYEQAVDLQLKKIMEQKGDEFHIPVLKWKKLEPLQTLTWEIVRRFGFHAAQATEVIRLLDGENGGYQSSDSHRIIRNRNWMIIAPQATATASHMLVEKDSRQITFAAGELSFSPIHHSPFTIPANPSTALLALSGIRFPLLLRRWKTGDYFYPLGMNRKKKLSRFLIDLKLSPTEKEKVWVLESDRKILWVIGYRIDHRFRVTEHTREALEITYRR